MSEIEAEIERAARQVCAKGSDEGVMHLEYEATMIASDVHKKYGGDVGSHIHKAIEIMERVRRAANPKRQAEIDAEIEFVTSHSDMDDTHLTITCTSFSLAERYGGQPIEYMERVCNSVKKAKLEKEKMQRGSCNAGQDCRGQISADSQGRAAGIE